MSEGNETLLSVILVVVIATFISTAIYLEKILNIMEGG